MKTSMSLVAAIATIVGAADLSVHAQFIGETGVLKPMVEGAKTVPVCVDQKALDAFYKAVTAQDGEGMMELFDSGRLIAPDVGTKIRVLDNHGFIARVTEVRILDGVYKGRRGFVSSHCVSDK